MSGKRGTTVKLTIKGVDLMTQKTPRQVLIFQGTQFSWVPLLILLRLK